MQNAGIALVVALVIGGFIVMSSKSFAGSSGGGGGSGFSMPSLNFGGGGDGDDYDRLIDVEKSFNRDNQWNNSNWNRSIRPMGDGITPEWRHR